MKILPEIIFFAGSLVIILLQLCARFFKARRDLFFLLSCVFLIMGIFIIIHSAIIMAKDWHFFIKIALCLFIILSLGYIIRVKIIYTRPNVKPPYHFEQVKLITKDGVALYGEYIDDGKEKTIIILHGITVNLRSDYIVNLAAFLSKDYNVLCIDFRGHGKSSGALNGNEYLDVAAAVDYLKNKDRTKIGVIGISLGSFTALYSQYRQKNIENLLIISPFYSKKLTETKLKIANTIGQRIFCRIIEAELGKKWIVAPPEDYADKIESCKIMIITGKEDRFSPPEEAEGLYQKLKTEKKLLIMSGSHAHKLLTKNASVCYEAIKEWFDETL